MQSSLCLTPKNPPKYFLNWKINKTKTELIGSGSNRTIRYELSLKTEYTITNSKDGKVIFKDMVYSSSEYNVLEDQIISTLASEKATEEMIVKNIKIIILNKIYLFAENNEN